MHACCCPIPDIATPSDKSLCPCNGSKGKPIKLITLKSLLQPMALEQLDPQQAYFFCAHAECPIVYFSEVGQKFTTDDVKVSVFQKEQRDAIPVCYCFGWSRQRIRDEIQQRGESRAIASITAHIKAKRCGCEVNNPQGLCCLENVRSVIQEVMSIG
jgi:hypothetical protein